MKCLFCNEEVPSGSLFCPMCGKALPEDIKPSDTKEIPAPEMPEEVSQSEPCFEASEPLQNESASEASEEPPYKKQTVVFPGIQSPVNYSEEAAKSASEAPYGTPKKAVRRKDYNAYPVASLVTALVNAVCFLCLGIPFSAAGIIFGIIGIKSERKSMSITAMILNCVALIIGAVLTVCFTVFAVRYSAELF